MVRVASRLLQVLSHVRREWRVMRQRRFHFLIFFVTGRCNARCSFCFYWQEIGQGSEDMSLVEIERLARTTPPFGILLLSGGEPFLRQDLVELVSLFRQHNEIRVVSIPTNGLLPGRIEAMTGKILESNPGLCASVNLSLDGFAEVHDNIRGVPGCFDKVEETLARLTRLRQAYPGRLEVNINSVLCARNYETLPALARHAAAHYDLDGHFFEIVREQSQDKSMLQVPPQALRQLYAELFAVQLSYFRAQKPFLLRWWRKVTFGGNLLYQYQVQYNNYVHGRRWDAPCLAGQTIAVVDYDGHVRACELHAPVANLRDHAGSFEAIYHSPSMQAERVKARSHACDCTHVCFITSSWMHSPRVRLCIAPWLYLRYLLLRRVVL
jgi:MoaA/NifB/PqqE/SkfB family radical SAM enzyme